MKNIQSTRLAVVMLTVSIFAFASIGYTQVPGLAADAQSQAKTLQVPLGQKMNVEGVILSCQSGSLTLRSLEGANYNIVVADSTALKEKKSNPFRGAKKYSSADLIPGLQVEVKGVGDSAGSIIANEIRMRNDDFKAAQTMDARVIPVENRLKDTQSRLGETEQNAQRLSGQVQELSAVSNAARGGAKAAQETADNAMNAANDARSRADNAQTGVHAANERITSLDNYTVKSTATVHFKAGSSALAAEEKSDLEQFAEQVKGEKGFLIEVAGFASADGDEAFNRRLSQKRADAVIQYLAEIYSIPLRRFVTPMGYGESQPVADNHTRDGRKENRRVEVRILVSKGLITMEGALSTNPRTDRAATGGHLE